MYSLRNTILIVTLWGYESTVACAKNVFTHAVAKHIVCGLQNLVIRRAENSSIRHAMESSGRDHRTDLGCPFQE